MVIARAQISTRHWKGNAVGPQEYRYIDQGEFSFQFSIGICVFHIRQCHERRGFLQPILAGAIPEIVVDILNFIKLAIF